MPESHVQRMGKDPGLKMNFRIEAGGIAVADFRTCTMPEATWSTVGYRAGTDPPADRFQRAKKSISDVTLTRGLCKDVSGMKDWFESGDRQSVSLIQLDHLGNEMQRIECFEVFPVAFKPIDDTDADSDGINVESITLKVEDM